MVTPVMPTYGRTEVAFERGEGAWLIDTSGQRYLDFGAGIAVNCLGHSHPGLVKALQDQAGKLWHTSNLYQIPGQTRLAERLVANSFADTVFFGNSGAEAVECGIKMARKYHAMTGNPGRYRIITFEGAFHGRTLATIAAGAQEKHLAGFGPVVDGFDQVPFGDVDAVKAAITDQTAAILVEPIQGESGIRELPAETLHQLRALADETGVLLFYDEVQCGMGRTGKLFAHEWAGAAPDIMAVAKALGGGFPIGACMATEKAAQGMTGGTHGSTFGGNPLAVAVANAVLDEMLADGFLSDVVDNGEKLRAGLERLEISHHNKILEVRGTGLMLGFKVRGDNLALIGKLVDAGLLTVVAGDGVVRLLPPLNIGDAEIDRALDVLDQVLGEFES